MKYTIVIFVSLLLINSIIFSGCKNQTGNSTSADSTHSSSSLQSTTMTTSKDTVRPDRTKALTEHQEIIQDTPKILQPSAENDSATSKSSRNQSSSLERPTNSSTSRFIVSFYSIGSGTETDQVDLLRTHINQYGEQHKKQISYNLVPWGREGEMDFCFTLKELTPVQQKDFVISTHNILSKARWVHFSENQPCRQTR
jgi:hypothetical protein